MDRQKSDHRRTARVPYAGELLVYRGNERLVCNGQNISRGGMLIRAPETYEQSRYLRLLFTLPGEGRWVHADALLVREEQPSSGSSWGVQFQQLSSDTAQQIAHYLAAQGILH